MGSGPLLALGVAFKDGRKGKVKEKKEILMKRRKEKEEIND